MKEVEVDEEAILFRVNSRCYRENMSEHDMYEATRGTWKVGSGREKAKYAHMVYKGEIKAVFAINSWHVAGTTIYAVRPDSDTCVPGRWEFQGSKAPESIRNKYVGNCVSRYFERGNANPITYVNCQVQTHNKKIQVTPAAHLIRALMSTFKK